MSASSYPQDTLEVESSVEASAQYSVEFDCKRGFSGLLFSPLSHPHSQGRALLSLFVFLLSFPGRAEGVEVREGLSRRFLEELVGGFELFLGESCKVVGAGVVQFFEEVKG